ncbi:acetyl-CoA acetyltransferase [Altererythrobacter aerius]|uniref:Acetyl-CoA acetyltransferase n=1 Tax=Tsuneonella aeria TaxID=1837929 RepID=A0A6I4TDP0_9SPHN|nr:acetyl-CoA acetyltransferase [Tsuneonella aeria]MXO74285.1 acetyl-CoA acetyltransferase [Tsuneonella aeria]
MVQELSSDAVDRTPVIVGVAQVVERIGDPDYRARSAADLAAWAAERALADAGAARDLRPLIESVSAIRTFADSGAAPAPFGKPDKFPLAVARRVGLTPRHAVLEAVGGQSPVTALVGLADRIARGEVGAGMVFGAEAISTTRHLVALGETRDWAEHDEGEVEDRGAMRVLTSEGIAHGIVTAPIAYALLENARRARLDLSREAYRAAMGELFAPFSAVAAANPFSSAASEPLSAEDIAAVTPRNRMIADPFPLKVVARDQVNMGAALLVMSAAAAREAGIPESQWVFIHGAAQAEEPDILDRADPGAYPAAAAALDAALGAAGKGIADMAVLDFYSCFPIAVFSTAIDHLGLAPGDPRGLTVTGGLPYFGGAGNGYSSHAIAGMVDRLRAQPGAFGLLGANGGFQSKYAALVLSTRPAPFPGWSVTQPARAAPPPRAERAEGVGTIETYTIAYGRDGPTYAIAIGRLADGRRFIARSDDPATVAEMEAHEPLGRQVTLSSDGERNAFTLTA